MSYKVLSFEGFVQEFKSVSVGPYPRKFCFVLGAGASKTSGIKTGEELVDIWDKELATRNPESHVQWKQEHAIDDANKYSFYSQYYEKRFEKDNGNRYRDGYNFLETMMDRAHPSCGYVHLALLMAKTMHNVVITTNFDHLTEDCLVQYAQTMPMVIGHEQLAPYAAQQITRPTVIKIHRDLLLNPINKTEELNRLHENWEKVLDSIFSVYHPVFIGYAGNDNSVMDFLCTHIDRFNSDVWACPYWLIYGSKQPEQKVKYFLENTNGYLIHHNGFDQVLVQLSYALNIRLPDEETFMEKTRKQYERLLDSVGSLMDASVSAAPNSEILETIGADALEHADQEDVATLYSQFVILFTKRMYDSALTLIKRLAKRDPDNPRYHSNMGVTLHEMGRYEEALAEMQKAVHLEPGNAKYRDNLGVTLYAMGRYEEALAETQKAVDLEPDTAQYRNNLGANLYELRRYEEALAEMRKAVDLEPDNADYHDGLGDILHGMGRYEEALAETQKAVDLDPNTARHHRSLGVILYRMRRYEEALTEMRKAVDLEPDTPDYHDGLGNILHGMGRYEKALAEMRKAVDLDPNNADYHDSLGNILHGMGRYEEALAEKKKAVDLESDNARYHNSLCETLQAIGAYKQAQEEAQKAVDLERNNAKYHHDLGATLYAMGRYAEALTETQKAVDLEPDNAGYCDGFQLALCAVKRHKKRRNDRSKSDRTGAIAQTHKNV